MCLINICCNKRRIDILLVFFDKIFNPVTFTTIMLLLFESFHLSISSLIKKLKHSLFCLVTQNQYQVTRSQLSWNSTKSSVISSSQNFGTINLTSMMSQRTRWVFGASGIDRDLPIPSSEVYPLGQTSICKPAPIRSHFTFCQ